jgi:hypothetical protein
MGNSFWRSAFLYYYYYYYYYYGNEVPGDQGGEGILLDDYTVDRMVMLRAIIFQRVEIRV